MGRAEGSDLRQGAGEGSSSEVVSEAVSEELLTELEVCTGCLARACSKRASFLIDFLFPVGLHVPGRAVVEVILPVISLDGYLQLLLFGRD